MACGDNRRKTHNVFSERAGVGDKVNKRETGMEECCIAAGGFGSQSLSLQ